MNINSVPTEAISIYNKALENTSKGDLSTAMAEYQKAIKMYPYFIEAYNNLGELYSLMGDNAMAISTYNRALDIARNHKILLNLGVVYYNSGNYSDALKYFLESLKERSDFHEGNYYTGLTYYNLKDYKNAERFLLAVLNKDKMHLKASYMLSHIYYEWKRYSDVIEILKNIWSIADNKEFINKYYGFCCFHLGRYEEAVKYLRQAITLHPEYEKFKNYLESLTYENKIKEVGDIDKAITELESLMMKGNLNLRDVTRLSMLYIFKGENKKAEKIVTEYKEKFVKVQ
ncbi:MAG TPA: tetratricopeptide repeat protein [Spirochaetota bacterium]|jgi:tetratricopeptide (TPR) repeat protein|nr:tetratricopeptide repeat protein [Spirochaetota bacterium]HOK01749.1 tetratricopeptide repeat protein [Spirochaetota bacterium]HOK91897.1 tetratricopeptide repeat protein [Spirochaetota bacterium]HON15370.1 tetratricopeptide repeat protein [Spirochaetota bacterium]HOV08963.1 tetratricopeptide repeat protein [Spirochaetota bacterium]